MYRLQTLGGFGGKADQLNAYNVYCGTPDFSGRDLQRYLTVGREDLSSAAAGLAPEVTTALSVVPRGSPALALSGSEAMIA